jgi:hypothetical protein
MLRRLGLLWALLFSPSDANADLFLTKETGAADVLITITKKAEAADCWVHTSDITNTPVEGDIWAVVTNNVEAADKWVMITDNLGAADPLTCLFEK